MIISKKNTNQDTVGKTETMKHQRDVDVALDWPNPGPVSTHKKKASKHYYPLVMTNIAMGNGSFIVEFPIKKCDFP